MFLSAQASPLSSKTHAVRLKVRKRDGIRPPIFQERFSKQRDTQGIDNTVF